VFSKILIANRGEIAVRIARAARELGVRTVAVHSEADRRSPHVLAADESLLIGPAPSAESYLRGDRLIEAALRAGAEAIHPGYGFLSERAAFIEAVEQAGLVFIGPSATAVTTMGDKAQARRRMDAAGVPVVPGAMHPLRTPEEALEIATAIGYPILLKASAGGGGRGMRLVRAPAEMEDSFSSASSEASGAFGDGSLYAERYLEGPRHIEIQLLADRAGNTVHLGERDCSIQRRHQKMIEEAPALVLTADERERIGATAVAAARAVDYLGAGTVEFLYQEGEFFFLEMNTRIQVEHPMTKMTTGIDLVQWQIRIAAGETLGFAQEDIRFSGHAIECRITAEDPAQGFLPSAGTVSRLELPSGPGVRWDAGIVEGSEVGLHYDPMLAKLIVHAADRPAAIARMERALGELVIEGIESSIPFHLAMMRNEAYREGKIDITFVERNAEALSRPVIPADERRAFAVAAARLEHELRGRTVVPLAGPPDSGETSAWKWGAGWRRG